VSFALLMVASVTLVRMNNVRNRNGSAETATTAPVVAAAIQTAAEPGTAVGDLQALDKNQNLYSDFDVLDDLEVQQDVTANP
jgi:hypothetical protein